MVAPRFVPRERDCVVIAALRAKAKGYSWAEIAKRLGASQGSSIQRACFAVRDDDTIYSTMPREDGLPSETEDEVRAEYW